MLLTCSRCKRTKSIDDFYRSKREPNGRKRQCAECARTTAAASRARNRETIRARTKADIKANPERWRAQRYRSRYGLTLEELDRMKEAANGRCRICGKEAELVVDHDHVSNRVRDVICNKCNTGLGLFGDNPEVLDSAAGYLREFYVASD